MVLVCPESDSCAPFSSGILNDLSSPVALAMRRPNSALIQRATHLPKNIVEHSTQRANRAQKQKKESRLMTAYSAMSCPST